MDKKLRIRLKSYDIGLLESSVQQIVAKAGSTGAKVVGPIPLPTRISRYTVLRSPHIDKKSREQFEIRKHVRLIEIIDAQPKFTESLNNLQLTNGVDIKVDVL
jgi:small subunit ribosomal protein S10